MGWTKLSRWEKGLYLVILVLAIFSRFYILGDRVMSHDESLHTKYSWYLYAGQGYQHNPMMHGPFLFHATALNYFLFGVNDFAARIFPALVGVLLVLSPVLFRRWLGKIGTAVAATLLLLSPSISYYSRYVRHDAFNMLTAVLLIWAIFYYLQEGKARWLYILAASFALLYTTKETSYIYTAIFGLLLCAPFAWRILVGAWERPELYGFFLLALALLIVAAAIFGYAFVGAEYQETALDEQGTNVAHVVLPLWGRIAALAMLLTLLALGGLVFFGVGEQLLRQWRSFDLLMVLGTLTLPLSAALFARLAGVDMLALYDALMGGDFSALLAADLVVTLVVVLVMLLASIFLGLWWDMRRWPVVAIVHYAIFTVFYTTFFTNAIGFLSGLLAALAYWMAQHGVQRGGQPGYYYQLLMPLYEYLPLLLSLLGAGGAVMVGASRLFRQPDAAEREPQPVRPSCDLWVYFPLFMLGWTLASWIGYSYAGEKMPWLLVHIALPSIFLAGWGVDRALVGLSAEDWGKRRGWVIPVILPLLLVALLVLASGLGGVTRGAVTTAGPLLETLAQWGNVFGALFGLAAAIAALFWAFQALNWRAAVQLTLVTVMALLGLLTVRTMVMFNFITYDLATEFLVYAHGAPGVKIALEQIEEISWRTTGTAREVAVAYSEDGSWPMAWYMVDYPNAYFYSRTPDPNQLRNCPVIIAGAQQYSAVDQVLGDDYIYFEYTYLWWPIQDYFGLDSARVRYALTDPAMRAALWDIFWQRDYTRYATAMTRSFRAAVLRGLRALETYGGYFPQVTAQQISLEAWPLRKDFRLYVRRDLAYEVWGYRLGMTDPAAESDRGVVGAADPYAQGATLLRQVGVLNLEDAVPRAVAIAPDGTLYVTDTGGHRIWHLTEQGAVLDVWGGFGSTPGLFIEPWGVAVDAEGYVYVADTWNHRVQKFDAQGEFVLSWGTLGQSLDGIELPGAFYGPRGIAVGPEGNLYVADTGNKRIQVFTPEGEFVRQLGAPGWDLGQFDEPVGVTISATGEILVADAWNQRVQVLAPEGVALRQWPVPVWDAAHPEMKPYVATDVAGNVYVTDPLNARVLAFNSQGDFLWSVGQLSSMGVPLSFPQAVAVSADQILYVTDAYAGRVVAYELP